MTSLIAEFFISIHSRHCVKLENFSSLYGMIYSDKFVCEITVEKKFQ